MGLNLEHCCKKMNFRLKNREIHLNYSQKCREYSIDYKRKYGGGVQLINFCPWCGKQLPKGLTEELAKIMFDDLDLADWDDPNLPEEFKSDEWWKKRNL